MNSSNPFVILYFAVGLLLGAVAALLGLSADLPEATPDAGHVHRLLGFLPVLVIGGIAVGGLTVLLARGIYLIYFHDQRKDNYPKHD